MTCKILTGVWDVDAAVALKVNEEGEVVGGFLCLRNFLPKHLRTRDNMSPLLAEIHQRQSGAQVEVVIPSMEEAEAILGEINRNMPAFLKFYPTGMGFEVDFVTRLIKAACCPIKLGQMTGITWDAKRLEIILPEDVKDIKVLLTLRSKIGIST
jgi:hypothetical protein